MTYVHHVDAAVPRAVWGECYFALLSLKMHLQSLPGWQEMSITARDDLGDVEVWIDTSWEDLGHLGTWLEEGVTPDALIRSIAPRTAQVHVRLAATI